MFLHVYIMLEMINIINESMTSFAILWLNYNYKFYTY